MAESITCPNCGSRVSPRLEEGSSRCPECGASLEGIEAGRVPPGSAPEDAAARRASERRDDGGQVIH